MTGMDMPARQGEKCDAEPSDDRRAGDAGPANLARLRALCLIGRLHHVAADPATLAHQLGIPLSREATLEELLLGAKHLGLKAKLSRSQPDLLHHSSRAPVPSLHPKDLDEDILQRAP